MSTRWWRLLFVPTLALAGCQGGERGPARPPNVCVSLSPGESAIVENDQSGLFARYSLRRPAPDRYDAYLNLHFVARDPVADAAAARYLAQATASCLENAAAWLRGPEGESLRLHLVREGETGVPIPAQVTIHVTLGTGERGHSKLWRGDWSCPQIVHEAFHLVGLVDEYAETDLARYPYDCRALGPRTSLMAYPFEAYAAITARRRHSLLFPGQFRAIVRPGCQDVNGTFYRCAVNAYRGGPACVETPPECRGGNVEWITR